MAVSFQLISKKYILKKYILFQKHDRDLLEVPEAMDFLLCLLSYTWEIKKSTKEKMR